MNGVVARITLNRPDEANALKLDLARHLKAQVDDAVDRGAQILLLSAEDPSFCEEAMSQR